MVSVLLSSPFYDEIDLLFFFYDEYISRFTPNLVFVFETRTSFSSLSFFGIVMVICVWVLKMPTIILLRCLLWFPLTNFLILWLTPWLKAWVLRFMHGKTLRFVNVFMWALIILCIANYEITWLLLGVWFCCIRLLFVISMNFFFLIANRCCFSSCRVVRFGDMLDQCSLLDLEFFLVLNILGKWFSVGVGEGGCLSLSV